MSEIGRPQTITQSSRKGKRSWRKNVDISDIEKKLQEQREDIIHHGKLLSEIESEDLFIIDEDVDEEVEKKLKKDKIKKLKSSEILENKSKVPALLSRVGKSKKKSKVQGVDKKEMVQLLKLAGKVRGYNKEDERIAKEGIVRSKAFDIWNTELDHEIELKSKPRVLIENSSISFTQATVIPKTIKETPIQIRKYEILPHAGKSYNPSLENWKHLIDQEYFKEKTKEDKRLLLEEHKSKIQFLISNYEDNEIIEEDDDDDEDDDEEEDNNDEIELDAKLSINPATALKIKTKTQRNKEKRNKERKKLESELKEIKLRIKELEKIPEILEQVNEFENNDKESSTPIESEKEKALRRGKKKLGSRFEVLEAPIEVKLRNELSDSLRKLKPEGNLLYDQMKTFQSKGMIETRRIAKGKKAKKKVSEKWSYKDFK